MTATVTHSWSHHTHYAFYSVCSKLCPKSLVLLSATWRTKSSTPQGLICCQWKEWQELQVQCSGDPDLHPFWESWGQSSSQKCLPSPTQHGQQQKHPLSVTGFTCFPHHVSQMYNQGKKNKQLLALDTFHSMAEQFGDTFSKNKKINSSDRSEFVQHRPSLVHVHSQTLKYFSMDIVQSCWQQETPRPQGSPKPWRGNTHKPTLCHPTAPSCKGITRGRVNLERQQ